ncbi:MAG: hypothetical protein AAGF31_10040 [Planctomycetota bacterium]
MRAPLVSIFLFASCLLPAMTDSASAQAFWKRFVPVQRVEADQAADYSLTQENGPWLVMACTFSGEGAERQARDLVVEFRKRFNIPAYAHAMEFNMSGEAVGRGLDKYGAPVRMKYRKGDRLQEWAVLAGDFPTIDDPEGQKLLQTIKTLRPDALTPGENGETSQSLALARLSQAVFVPRIGNNKQLGPMRTAFMARNPMLPQEYFVPKGVDKFVEKMNRGLPYSLLNNKKKFTVKVATFDGQTELQGAKTTSKGRRKRNKRSALEEAVDNAELLAAEMRKAGFDAYSFHDRHESIVTVGGFDAVTQRGFDGSQAPVPEIAQLLRTFGARFNTPEDPLQRAQMPMHVRAKAEQNRQKFKQVFQAEHTQVAGGLTPKFARVPPNSPNAKVIPFDIHPTLMEVPSKTISAGFAWRR